MTGPPLATRTSLSSPNLGAGCLTLFALPFAGVGLFVLWVALEKLEEGASIGEIGFFALVGLVFAAVGFGLIALGRMGKRKLEERTRLRERHPEEPWLWREEWLRGRIPGSSKGTMIAAWAFAFFWNAISLPGVLGGWSEIAREGIGITLLVLMFPLVGLGLLAWAVRATLQWRAFGTSTFVPDRLPGVIGGELRGRIETSFVPRREGSIELTLTSVRRVTTGSGKNRSTSEHVLWQGEQALFASSVSPVVEGAAIPVRFDIPFECDSTDEEIPNNQVVWRFAVRSALPGVDYESTFEVPVFRTAESSKEITEAKCVEEAGPEGPSERPATSSLAFEPTACGGMALRSGPAANPGAAAGLTAFTAVWCLVTAYLWYQAPFFFGIVFGLFALLMIFASVWSWLGTTRVAVEGGSITVRHAILGLGWSRDVLCADVESVRAKSSGRTGSKVTYDLALHTRDGKSKGIGLSVPSKPEAEWLATEMVRAIRSS